MWKITVGVILVAWMQCWNICEGGIIWQCEYFDPVDPFGACEWNLITPVYDEQNMAIVPDPEVPDECSDDCVLRAFYPNGSYAGNPDDKGGIEYWARPFQAADEFTLTYEVYFSGNLDFVEGGKLPGFSGGEDPKDRICAGGSERVDCFSTRFMWDIDGEGYVYAYLIGDEGYGREIGRDTFWFTTGIWHTISQHLRMNTPGEEDGVLEIYLDGELKHVTDDLLYREDNTLQIDTIFFSTFFGGSSRPDFASTTDCYSYYRNFTVSD